MSLHMLHEVATDLDFTLSTSFSWLSKIIEPPWLLQGYQCHWKTAISGYGGEKKKAPLEFLFKEAKVTSVTLHTVGS